MATTYAPFSAGQRLTADALNKAILQETMPWTDLATLGTFATNFSAGAQTPQMRKIIEAGSETWEFRGTINCSATFTQGTTITMFTFTDTANRVASEREFAAQASQSGYYPVRLGFMTNGTVTGGVPANALSTTSVIWLDGEIRNPKG